MQMRRKRLELHNLLSSARIEQIYEYSTFTTNNLFRTIFHLLLLILKQLKLLIVAFTI